MGTSVKTNFALNLINTLSGLFFPLITFPYASRILLADGIGQIQFFQGIINYVGLCTALGIPIYAIREIARVRKDKVLCSKTTVEILLLHSLLTLVGYIIVFILIFTVTKIQADIPLFLLLSAHLFFSAIGALWFYQGIEDFKYITIRAVLVRLFSLICLFVFIKNKSDLFYYAAITITAEVGSNLFNFIRLRKFINLRELHFKELRPEKHLKPALKIFAMNLVISIYVNLDSVMLGFMKNEATVGYYAASTRIVKSILGVVQSLGTVLLPRFTNLISDNRMDEFRLLADKAINFTLAISLPLTVGLIFMAPPLIHLFCGNGFEPAILTMQIIAPIILFISISGIMGWQVLFPLDKEKLVIYATSVGAIINFILNMILIPFYSQYGAAIATSIAECFVMIIAVLFARRYIIVNLISKYNIHYYIATGIIAIFLFLLGFLNLKEIWFAFIGILFSIMIYAGYLFFKKDVFIVLIQNIIANNLKKNKYE